MRGLLGYRFLSWFAGDLKNRRKQPTSTFYDQLQKSDFEMNDGPFSPAFEEDHGNQLSQNEDGQNESQPPA